MIERTHLRSVFLAAIVLLSVVALGTGGAVAQPAETDGPTPADVDASDLQSIAIQENSTDADDEDGPSVSAEPQEVRVADGLSNQTNETVLLLTVDRDLDREAVRTGRVDANTLEADSNATLEPVARQISRLEGATIRKKFWVSNTISVRADLDAHSVEEFASIDGVTGVTPNPVARTPTPSEPDTGARTQQVSEYTYGPAQIDVPGFESRYGDRGGNASIAIIDDGMSDPQQGHPDIDIATKAVAVDGEVQTGTLGTPGAHGEHVAGIATGAADPAGDVPRYGVAPNASLTMINAFEGDPTGEDILASVQYAVEHDHDVASMSLGFSSTTGNSVVWVAMEKMMQDANAAGTLVVGSAGNAGSGEDGGPATSPGAEFSGFSIGGTQEGRGMYTSSSGAIVSPYAVEFVGNGTYPETYPRSFVRPDVTAPGQSVLSAGPVGSTIVPDPNATYSLASGTSMAAPHAAGASLLIQSETEAELDPRLIQSALEETAEKPPNDHPSRHGRDIRYGTGIINVTAATMEIKDGTRTIDGTVTDTDGDPIVGASVRTDEGALTSTDENGSYTLQTVGESVNVTVDAYGYVSETVAVSADDQPVDVTLADELAVDLVDDQAVYAAFGTQINTTADVRNLENVTVSLSDATNVSRDDLTLRIDGANATFGQPHDLDRFDGELTVLVDVAEDADVEEGSLIGLETTYEGLDENVAISTGPTTLTAELEPAHFELSNLQAPDEQVIDSPLPMTVEVTNTGQVSDAKLIQTFVDDGDTEGTLPPQQLTLEPGETEQYEVATAGLSDLYDAGAVIDAGFRTADGQGLLGDLVGINDEASTQVALQAAGTSFRVSDLQAPTEVDAGEEYEATATIQNAGNQAGERTVTYRIDGETVATETVQLGAFGLDANATTEVSFTATAPEASGVYTHGIETPDDAATTYLGVGEQVPNVTVVSTSSDFGGQTVDLLERGMGVSGQPAVVDYTASADVDESVIEHTDVFVFHDLGDDSADVISTVEESPATSAVYLEQIADSNAIAARSDALNDPESSFAAFGDGDAVAFEVVEDHPLFEGVANGGERVTVHTFADADRAWFEGASGETLAEVGVRNGSTDGPVAAVDPDSGSVLLGTIAPNRYEAESSFTDAGAAILANAVGVANENVVADAVAETSVDAEFVGVVEDEERVAIEATGIVVDGQPVDGEQVTFTVGGEPVARATATDGTANATFDPATLDLEAGQTASVGIAEHPVLEVDQIEIVHETVDLQDGYNLLSVPQPATLSTEDVAAVTTWDTANGTYETVTDATFDDYEDLHRGLYVSATDESARAGYTFSDDVPSGGTAEIAPGWTLTSSNFAIDSVEQGDQRTLDDDLLGVDPSWLTVFSADFDQRYDGNSTIGGYDTYWIRSEAEQPTDRAIVSPSYELGDRRAVLGQGQSNFTITDVSIVEGVGADQDDGFLGAGEGAITVEATVENAGDAADVQFADLAVDARQNGTFERVDRSAALALDAGEHDTVTLTYDVSHEDAPGIDFRVETADDASAPRTITFEGGEFDVSDQALTLNDELVVETVDVGGEATVEVLHNDTVVGSRTVADENDTDVRVALDEPVTGSVDVRLSDAAGDQLTTETVTITEPTIGLDASGPENASADETVQIDVDVENDALVEESMLVELTVDGQKLDDTAVNVDDATSVTLALDTDELDVSAGDTVEYTVTAGDGSDTGQLTIE